MRPIKPPVARPTPPYDTGKVKIGLLYAPPPNWSPDRDAYFLQSALLPRSPVRAPLSSRLSTFFWSLV